MSEANARFLGTIPELYDRHLGPVIFEPYAADLARRVPVAPAGPVLEVACGTGILTQQLRARLSPTVQLVAAGARSYRAGGRRLTCLKLASIQSSHVRRS